MKKDQKTSVQPTRLTAAFFDCRTLLARMVGRIVRPHDIEDIVQETFIRCFEAERVRVIRHPRSFMLKTARNLALNHLARADQRLTDRLEDFAGADVSPTTLSAEATAEGRQRFLLFCRAVRELPLQCRRAFLLKKVYGFSQRDIADFMELSESTVEKHIIKGLFLCGEFMAKAELSSDAPRSTADGKKSLGGTG
jgi:RNA polymerase sigma factor (sigma-70 family)